jgi:hypothetical protein
MAQGPLPRPASGLEPLATALAPFVIKLPPPPPSPSPSPFPSSCPHFFPHVVNSSSLAPAHARPT